MVLAPAVFVTSCQTGPPPFVVEIFVLPVGQKAVDAHRIRRNGRAEDVLVAGRINFRVFVKVVGSVAGGAQVAEAAGLSIGAVADVVKAIAILLAGDLPSPRSGMTRKIPQRRSHAEQAKQKGAPNHFHWHGFCIGWRVKFN